MKKNTIFLLFLLGTSMACLQAMELPTPPFGPSYCDPAFALDESDIDFTALSAIVEFAGTPDEAGLLLAEQNNRFASMMHSTSLQHLLNPPLLPFGAAFHRQAQTPYLQLCPFGNLNLLESITPADAENPGLKDAKKLVKIYRCGYEDCSKSFAKIYAIKEHICAHLKLKPYRCTAQGCSYRSMTKYHLTMHIRRIHKDQPGLQIPKLSKQDLKRMEEAIAPYLKKSSEICEAKRPRNLFPIKHQLTLDSFKSKIATTIEDRTSQQKESRKKRPADVALAIPAAAKAATVAEPSKELAVYLPDLAFRCQTCTRSFGSEKGLRRHIGSMHHGTPKPEQKLIVKWRN
ncbi:hypothetical protein BH09DEP1_BH09DEP1_2160 [soil metagenome]